MLKESNNLKFFDILNILSFYTQLENIQKDNEQNKLIKQIIKAIANEINLLHKENEKIINQNEHIIKLLKEGEVKPYATNN